MRNDIEKKKEEILKWIKENKSKAFIYKSLKCKADTLENYLKKWNVNYIGNAGNKGYKVSTNKKSALEYMSKEFGVNSYVLKNKLIEDGIKEEKCELCGNNIWNGKKIPTALHHIDGNKNNNKLENLQILCYNCHAQTDNFGIKNYIEDKVDDNKIIEIIKVSTTISEVLKKCGMANKGGNYRRIYNIMFANNLMFLEKESKKQKIKKTYICIECGGICSKENSKCIKCCRVKKEKKEYFCIHCGNKVSKKNKMCVKCKQISQRKVNRPSYKQLEKEINETSYCAVGRKYGVSDKTIRKWIKYYEKEFK